MAGWGWNGAVVTKVTSQEELQGPTINRKTTEVLDEREAARRGVGRQSLDSEKSRENKGRSKTEKNKGKSDWD
eukprot:5616484-Pleurochrysis_carterae.AAC.2